MTFKFLPWLPVLLLGLLLFLAVWSDVKSRLISNKLIFLGAFIGITLQSLIPSGAGLFNDPFGGLGLLISIAGLCVGLIILIPLYALGAMGAGDAKLMAMIGAFVGPQAIIKVALLSLISGGLLAVVVSIWKGVFKQVVINVYTLLLSSLTHTLAGETLRIEAPAVQTVKLAYAIAIAAGTALYLVMSHYSIWRFI